MYSPKQADKRKPILSVTLSDCEVQTFRSGGKGGQNQNKRDTGVRVIHKPSGAIGESREQRSQLQNKRAAFTRMAETDKFRLWVNKMAGLELIRETPEQVVAKEMRPENLLIEVKSGGKWEKENGEKSS